jgi:predicted kinase
MSQLILFRGLPGAGKTTLAESLCDRVVSADQFFEKDGTYQFDANILYAAHKWCQRETERLLTEGNQIIGVANTFTMEKEMKAYFEIAERLNCRISTIIVENRHGSTNVHYVPEETMNKMEARFSIRLR